MFYKITNVKISVKCSTICLDTAINLLRHLKIEHKKYSNYLVVQSLYTYVIFKPSLKNGISHVNITKIPSIDDVNTAKMHLSNLLKIEICLVHTIDNITVSTKLEKSCSLKDIINLFNKYCKITFNQETFPGVFLKFSYGTVIVFHTGRCILIGCKSINSIESILETMTEILEKNGY